MEGLDPAAVALNVVPPSLRLGRTSFHVTAALSPAPGKDQDGLLVQEGFVAVADGATPLSAGRGADVATFVKELLTGLSHYRARSTVGMFRGAIQRAKRLGAQPWDVPSATVVTARAIGNDIRVDLLGDCMAIVKQGHTYTVLTDTSVHVAMDDDAIQKMTAIMASGASWQEAYEAITPLLRANRARMNQPDGYWVAADNVAAAEHVTSIQCPAASVDAILLCSDGFSRMCTTMGGASDERELLNLCLQMGVDGVIEDLRKREIQDSTLRHYPRFSVHDDATAVLLTK